MAHLSERDDELTQVFLSAVEADVVVGDEKLSHHVHLSERRPQRAVRVSVQTLVLRQTKHHAITLVLRPGVQIPAAKTRRKHQVRGQRSTSSLCVFRD